MAEKSPCYQCTREIKCPECHTFCPDFVKWDAKHRAMKQAEFQQRCISNGLYAQRAQLVFRANKTRRDR